jgi:hypothetical protein
MTKREIAYGKRLKAAMKAQKQNAFRQNNNSRVLDVTNSITAGIHSLPITDRDNSMVIVTERDIPETFRTAFCSFWVYPASQEIVSLVLGLSQADGQRTYFLVSTRKALQAAIDEFGLDYAWKAFAKTEAEVVQVAPVAVLDADTRAAERKFYQKYAFAPIMDSIADCWISWMVKNA